MTPAELDAYLIANWATTRIMDIKRATGALEWEIRLAVRRLRAQGKVVSRTPGGVQTTIERPAPAKVTVEKAAARRKKSDLPPRRLVDVTGRLDDGEIRTARDQVVAILDGWGVTLEWRRVGRAEVPYLDGKATTLAVLCARWEAEWERVRRPPLGAVSRLSVSSPQSCVCGASARLPFLRDGPPAPKAR